MTDTDLNFTPEMMRAIMAALDTTPAPAPDFTVEMMAALSDAWRAKACPRCGEALNG